MSPLTNSGSQPDLSSETSPTCSDYVVGAAVFDLNGLPSEYFTTSEEADISWIQTIFQALGLRSLLMSSLQLEGFHHATIYGTDYCAVVVKQPTYYVALLIRRQHDALALTLMQWVETIDLSELRQNPRFYRI